VSIIKYLQLNLTYDPCIRSSPMKMLTIPGEATITAAQSNGDGPPSLPRFKMLAYTGAAMQLAGWKYPVVVSLAGLSVPRQTVPLRMNHSADLGVGHTDTIVNANGTLTATGVISRSTPAAKDVADSAKNGFSWQVSIGAAVDEVDFIKQGESTTVNGRLFPGPLNVVTKSTLGEISFVDAGADGNTWSALVARRSGAPVKPVNPVDLLIATQESRQAMLSRIEVLCERTRVEQACERRQRALWAAELRVQQNAERRMNAFDFVVESGRKKVAAPLAPPSTAEELAAELQRERTDRQIEKMRQLGFSRCPV
jgi:hypothetical protein